MNDKIPLKLKKFIFWNQSISLSDVQRLLGLGKTRSNDYFIELKNYLQGNLVKSGHRYQVIGTLPFAFSSSSLLNELLTWKKNKESEEFYFKHNNVYIDPLYSPSYNDEAIKAILLALDQKEAIEIGYVDAKPNSNEEIRLIRPLALCFVNDRWHIHAYCYKREDTRDFVLSRITSTGKLVKLRFPGLAESIQKMQEMTSITIAAHPDLSLDQKKVVEREYEIIGDVRTIQIPKHQLFYFRKKYLAEENEGPPNKFLIEITNK